MLSDTRSLAEQLFEQRMALGMSIEDLAREARVSAQYVRALEENGYHMFPAKVYAQGAVRRVSRVFESGDTDMLVAALNREWPQGLSPEQYHASPVPRVWDVPVASRNIGAIAAAACILFLLGFWGIRVFVFAAPPLLVIDSPAPRSYVAMPVVSVAGRTEKESMLAVNGREIAVDERGHFAENLELQLGVNRLRFVSQSRFGKTTEEIRYVLVK